MIAVTASFLIFGAVIAVIGYCIFRKYFNGETAILLYYIGSVFLAAVILAAVISFLSSRYLKKQFVKPVEAISEEAVRFVSEHKPDRPLGDISRIHELTDLARSIDAMEAEITDYIRDQAAVTAEKERLGAELDLAKKIQESQVPREFPAFPGRKEFDVCGIVIPARMVGGDFYNYILIDEDHLAMWIGDVSGKGIPAALFMMSANLMLSARVRFKGSPAEILADVNNGICEKNDAEMFVTAWLGILSLSTGRLTAANAGHECPMVFRGGRFEKMKDKHGLALGGLKNSRYQDYEIDLLPGGKVFVYSDGVPEARNSEKEMYQFERLTDALNQNSDGSPKELIRSVKADIDAFVGDAAQFDDLTMLAVEYRG